MPLMSETPKAAGLGYRRPAEWEPHDATWLAWPHQREDWPGKFAPVPWVYCEIVKHLHRFERVNILVPDRRVRRQAKLALTATGVDPTSPAIEFVTAATDRSWLRDSLPCFVVRNIDNLPRDELAVAAVAWRFNGWAKYPNHRADARLPRKVSRRLRIERFKPRYERAGKARRVVLEGGAIDTNGRGTLLTTEECLLSSDVQIRNPGLDRAGYERIFAEQLGVRHTIWLGRGIAGDDTHGHVDDIARFVDPHTVVAAVEDDPSDPNHEPLQENLERLRSAVDQDGRLLRVVTLPMPEPVLFERCRLPASYANFYIANGVVLVPTFNDSNDREALNTLAGLFPDRRVVGIHCVDLVLGLGTLHCLSHEQPAAPAGETALESNEPAA
jgi:agmatine deiminase